MPWGRRSGGAGRTTTGCGSAAHAPSPTGGWRSSTRSTAVSPWCAPCPGASAPCATTGSSTTPPSCAGSWRSGAWRWRPGRTRRCCCGSASCSGRRRWRSWRAFSPSPSGTGAAAPCCWPGTGWASSRCFMPFRAPRWCSAASQKRCSPTRGSRRRRTPRAGRRCWPCPLPGRRGTAYLPGCGSCGAAIFC